jgi:hypothetical protein
MVLCFPIVRNEYVHVTVTTDSLRAICRSSNGPLDPLYSGLQSKINDVRSGDNMFKPPHYQENTHCLSKYSAPVNKNALNNRTRKDPASQCVYADNVSHVSFRFHSLRDHANISRSATRSPIKTSQLLLLLQEQSTHTSSLPGRYRSRSLPPTQPPEGQIVVVYVTVYSTAGNVVALVALLLSCVNVVACTEDLKSVVEF